MARRERERPRIDGLILVDKPVGLSSMDVVRRVRRAAGGAKTGHAGTLDPLASGLVICCLGRATRMVESLMDTAKTYRTQIDLSAFTTTDDREGQRRDVPPPDPLPQEPQVRNVLEGFVGVIPQRPPAFSAMHVNGKRAYKLARQGETVELPPRPVRIDSIELIDYAYPMLTIQVICGKGTYIRSLGRDVGLALHTGGHLASLRRTASGSFHVDHAHPITRFDQPITQEDLLPVA